MINYKINKIDFINVNILFIMLLLIYLNADIGFSYDYQYYYSYINQISSSTLDDIKYLQNGIYVYLKSSAGLEFGFVYLVKLISFVFSDATQIYAVIATTSLMLKIYVSRKYNVSWPWVYMIVIYSGVLLESNALRSGLSLTFFMCALLLIDKNKSAMAFFLFLLALSMHIQSLFFILLFSIFHFLYKNKFFNSLTNMYVLLILSVLTGVFVNLLLSVIIFGKLKEYSTNTSSYGGLNLSSFFLILTFLYYVYHMTKTNKVNVNIDSTAKYRILMLVPVVSISIFVTSIAALGDRLWQWGTVLLVISVCSYYNCRKDKVFVLNRVKLSIGKILLLINLLIVVTGIVYRYPLSNFFYPLLPYIDFSLLGFGT